MKKKIIALVMLSTISLATKAASLDSDYKRNVAISSNSSNISRLFKDMDENRKSVNLHQDRLNKHDGDIYQLYKRGGDSQRHISSNNSRIKDLEKSTNGRDVAINENTNAIKSIRNDMEEMARKMNGVEAMNMATSSLFQPYSVGKLNLTLGVGTYNDAHALALGSGYRINHNLAVRFNMSFEDANNSVGVGAGVSYEI